MRIKICGLFRDEDIDYINEARPDYAGFVFAKSKRQINPTFAQYLRFRLAEGIIPVGVFVNAPAAEVIALYQNGTISIAQLHGSEDGDYIHNLKKKSAAVNNNKPIKIIKVIQSKDLSALLPASDSRFPADYYLIDSGAGSGKTFNWKKLDRVKINKPWFLAGGINAKNIREAVKLKPYAVDISGGVEANGVKDRKKIIELVSIIRKENK